MFMCVSIRRKQTKVKMFALCPTEGWHDAMVPEGEPLRSCSFMFLRGNMRLSGTKAPSALIDTCNYCKEKTSFSWSQWLHLSPPFRPFTWGTLNHRQIPFTYTINPVVFLVTISSMAKNLSFVFLNPDVYKRFTHRLTYWKRWVPLDLMNE